MEFALTPKQSDIHAGGNRTSSFPYMVVVLGLLCQMVQGQNPGQSVRYEEGTSYDQQMGLSLIILKFPPHLAEVDNLQGVPPTGGKGETMVTP